MANINAGLNAFLANIIKFNISDKDKNGTLSDQEQKTGEALFAFSSDTNDFYSKMINGEWNEANAALPTVMNGIEEKAEIANLIADWDTNNNGKLDETEIVNDSIFGSINNIFAQNDTNDTLYIEDLQRFVDLIDINNDGQINDTEKNAFGTLVAGLQEGTILGSTLAETDQKNIFSSLQNAIKGNTLTSNQQSAIDSITGAEGILSQLINITTTTAPTPGPTTTTTPTPGPTTTTTPTPGPTTTTTPSPTPEPTTTTTPTPGPTTTTTPTPGPTTTTTPTPGPTTTTTPSPTPMPSIKGQVPENIYDEISAFGITAGNVTKIDDTTYTIETEERTYTYKISEEIINGNTATVVTQSYTISTGDKFEFKKSFINNAVQNGVKTITHKNGIVETFNYGTDQINPTSIITQKGNLKVEDYNGSDIINAVVEGDKIYIKISATKKIEVTANTTIYEDGKTFKIGNVLYNEHGNKYNGIRTEGDKQIHYTNGTKTNGFVKNQQTGIETYYQDGEIPSGYQEFTINGTEYLLLDGVKYTGTLDGHNYQNGIEQAYYFHNGDLYDENGIVQGYAVFNETLYFDGKKATGTHIFNNTLYENGTKDTTTRVYEDKLYVNGTKATGNVLHENVLYVNGTKATGNVLHENVLYVNGTKATGNVLHENILYVDGTKATGNILHENILYVDGTKATGNVLHENILYVDGTQATGTHIFNNTIYENGTKDTTTRVYDNVLYVNGTKATGNVLHENVLYVNGTQATGNVLHENILYVDGTQATGNVLHENILYVDGTQATGTHIFNNTIYENGTKDTTTRVYDDTLYVNGTKATSTQVFDNVLYVNGTIPTGQTTYNNKLYINGVLANNEVEDSTGNIKLYEQGVLATGTKEYGEKLYIDGILATGEIEHKTKDENGKDITKLYINGALAKDTQFHTTGEGDQTITKLFINGIAFTGDYEGDEYKDGICKSNYSYSPTTLITAISGKSSDTAVSSTEVIDFYNSTTDEEIKSILEKLLIIGNDGKATAVNDLYLCIANGNTKPQSGKTGNTDLSAEELANALYDKTSATKTTNITNANRKNLDILQTRLNLLKSMNIDAATNLLTGTVSINSLMNTPKALEILGIKSNELDRYTWSLINGLAINNTTDTISLNELITPSRNTQYFKNAQTVSTLIQTIDNYDGTINNTLTAANIKAMYLEYLNGTKKNDPNRTEILNLLECVFKKSGIINQANALDTQKLFVAAMDLINNNELNKAPSTVTPAPTITGKYTFDKLREIFGNDNYSISSTELIIAYNQTSDPELKAILACFVNIENGYAVSVKQGLFNAIDRSYESGYKDSATRADFIHFFSAITGDSKLPGTTPLNDALLNDIKTYGSQISDLILTIEGYDGKTTGETAANVKKMYLEYLQDTTKPNRAAILNMLKGFITFNADGTIKSTSDINSKTLFANALALAKANTLNQAPQIVQPATTLTGKYTIKQFVCDFFPNDNIQVAELIELYNTTNNAELKAIIAKFVNVQNGYAVSVKQDLFDKIATDATLTLAELTKFLMGTSNDTTQKTVITDEILAKLV